MNNISILNAIGINEYDEDKDEVVANCILCGDLKKNLQINFAKKVYHCWVCDSGGKLVKLIADIRGVTQEEAYKLFKLDEIDIRHELDEIDIILNEDRDRLYSYKRYKVENRYKYWKRRGIKVQYINQFNLGFDTFTNRLVIPVIFRNKCVAIIRRAVSIRQVPKYIYSKGFRKRKVLFGYDSIKLNEDNVVLTEGAIDTIKLRQLGFNSVALLGVNLHNIQMEMLTRDFSSVILALDNDDAGQEATYKIVRRLESLVDVYKLVYDLDDPGELKNVKQIKRIVPITLV